MISQCLPRSRHQDGKHGSVQVVHGAKWCSYDVAGRNVADMRQALGTVLNIPQEAQALANGVPVGEDYEIQTGDRVEFIRASGDKGLGDLIPAEQLMTAWHITEEQYKQLLALGLPKVDLGGSAWHSEIAVDEWFRESAAPRSGQATSSRSASWCHGGSEQPPSTHLHGPLVGNQMQLASWLFPRRKPDPRQLRTRAKNGIVWVRKNSGQECEVWFRTQQEFAEANARRLQERHENGEK